jgi:hypothetical protein
VSGFREYPRHVTVEINKHTTYITQRITYRGIQHLSGVGPHKLHKPVHVKTHGTGEDEHWLNMWTLEAERDSSNATSLSYSLGSSGGRFALKSWVLKEFVGYKFISKNSHLGLDIKTR